MNEMPAKKVYSFAELHEFQRKYNDRKFIGPRELLDDPKLIAGLLFKPRDSNSTRTIESSQYYFNGQHHVCIAFHLNFGYRDYRRIPITTEARKWLLEKSYVEGTASLGYTDMNRLYLSQRGKKTVVTEWLKDDIAITEYLAAGAIIHSDGRMTWQQ